MMEKVLLIVAASVLCCVSYLVPLQYHFVSELKNWTEAQSYCRQNYKDLATIATKADMDKLNATQVMEGKLPWIGLYNDAYSSKWLMSSGYSYKQNETGFINLAPVRLIAVMGQCGAILGSGNFYGLPCGQLLTAICSDFKGPKPTFFYINISVTWTEAQSYCRNYSGDLAIIRNHNESQQIQSLVPNNKYVWIGLLSGLWKWSDGLQSTFEYWKEGQPIHRLENCAAADFKDSGRWISSTCDVIRPFICNRDFQIRLSGPNWCSGRVEVLNEGSWGTVCHDHWGRNEALVACRQLGCGPPEIVRTSEFGPGTGRIWLNNVVCSGGESRLSQCLHNGFEKQSCNHSEDVGVVCSDLQIRLSGPNWCSGMVQVLNEGYWRTLCHDSWGMNETLVVCRQLGCGPPKSVHTNIYTPRTGQIWLNNVVCSGSESDLSQCLHKGFEKQSCGRSVGVEVTCSVTKKVIMRLETSSSVDPNDGTALDDMLNQLREMLKKKGVPGNVKVSWKKQPDGKVFHKETREKEMKKKKNEQDEL